MSRWSEKTEMAKLRRLPTRSSLRSPLKRSVKHYCLHQRRELIRQKFGRHSWEGSRRLGFLSSTASGYLNETLHRDFALNCIRRIWSWLWRERERLDSRCPTPQPVRNSSIVVSLTV